MQYCLYDFSTHFVGSTSPTSSNTCSLISSTTIVYPVKSCRVLEEIAIGLIYELEPTIIIILTLRSVAPLLL